MERRTFLHFCLASLAATTAAAAGARADTSLTDEQIIGIVFDEIERVIIEEYFGGDRDGKAKKNKTLPPGLAKRDELPPGLARQIRRNGTLPPGLRTYDLPSDLVSLLPPLTPGTRRAVVGNDVVLIREGTGYILDVIKDVLIQ